MYPSCCHTEHQKSVTCNTLIFNPKTMKVTPILSKISYLKGQEQAYELTTLVCTSLSFQLLNLLNDFHETRY